MFYVYLLLLKGGSIYKGMTENLKRRIADHMSGKVNSTKHKSPLKLIYYEAYLFKEDAEKREQYLKTTFGRRDIKRQLSHLLKKTTGSPDDKYRAPSVSH